MFAFSPTAFSDNAATPLRWRGGNAFPQASNPGYLGFGLGGEGNSRQNSFFRSGSRGPDAAVGDAVASSARRRRTFSGRVLRRVAPAKIHLWAFSAPSRFCVRRRPSFLGSPVRGVAACLLGKTAGGLPARLGLSSGGLRFLLRKSSRGVPGLSCPLFFLTLTAFLVAANFLCGAVGGGVFWEREGVRVSDCVACAVSSRNFCDNFP